MSQMGAMNANTMVVKKVKTMHLKKKMEILFQQVHFLFRNPAPPIITM